MLWWDSHSFQLSRLGTVPRLPFSRSLLGGLPGRRPPLPGPIAPGVGLSVSKLGARSVPGPALVGEKVNAGTEAALSASRGFPRRVWEPWIPREGRRRGPQPAGALNNPSLSPGHNVAHNLGVGHWGPHLHMPAQWPPVQTRSPGPVAGPTPHRPSLCSASPTRPPAAPSPAPQTPSPVPS